MSSVLIGLAAYMVLMLVIGGWIARRVNSVGDYLVAGRSMGVVLLSFSVFATWFGAEVVLSTSGKVYEEGMRGAAADPFGYAIAILVNGFFFATILWRGGYTTFADLFAQRFGKQTERFVAILFALSSLPWAAVQFQAFGHVLALHAEVSLSTAILIGGLFLTIYTLLGGLLADAVTDLIQGVVLIVGLLIIFVSVVVQNGGFAETLSQVDPQRFELFSGTEEGFWADLESWAIPILGTCLATEIVQRVLGARSGKVAMWGTVAGAAIYVIVALIPVFLGLVGPAVIPEIDDPEQLINVLAQQHLGGFLLIAFSGALVSVILSTADSILLTSAGIISQNLVTPLFPGISENRKLLVTRISVIVFAVGSLTLSLYAESMFGLIELGAQAGSSGIIVTASFGLFTRRGGQKSALSALIAGAAAWAAGYIAKIDAPFLASLVVSLATYVTLAFTLDGRCVQPGERQQAS